MFAAKRILIGAGLAYVGVHAYCDVAGLVPAQILREAATYAVDRLPWRRMPELSSCEVVINNVKHGLDVVAGSAKSAATTAVVAASAVGAGATGVVTALAPAAGTVARAAGETVSVVASTVNAGRLIFNVTFRICGYAVVLCFAGVAVCGVFSVSCYVAIGCYSMVRRALDLFGFPNIRGGAIVIRRPTACVPYDESVSQRLVTDLDDDMFGPEDAQKTVVPDDLDGIDSICGDLQDDDDESIELRYDVPLFEGDELHVNPRVVRRMEGADETQSTYTCLETARRYQDVAYEEHNADGVVAPVTSCVDLQWTAEAEEVPASTTPAQVDPIVGGALPYEVTRHIVSERKVEGKVTPPMRPIATAPVCRARTYNYKTTGEPVRKSRVIVETGSTNFSPYCIVYKEDVQYIHVNQSGITLENFKKALQSLSCVRDCMFYIDLGCLKKVSPGAAIKAVHQTGASTHSSIVLLDRAHEMIRTQVFDALTVSGMSALPNTVAVEREAIELSQHNTFNHDTTCVDAYVEHIQGLVNAFMPTTTFVDTSQHTDQFHTQDYYQEVNNVRFRYDRGIHQLPKFDRMRPLLSTACPAEQICTPRHLLHAIAKRNCNPPKLQSILSVYTESRDMVCRLIKCCKNLDVTPVSLSYDDMQDWLDDQRAALDDRIVAPEAMHNLSLDSYNISVKRLPKPDLTPNALSDYPAPQTILFTEKYVNAYFCTLWRVIRDRVIEALDERFLIYTGMSEDDFADVLTSRFPPSSARRYTALELDMKKYDKSQHELILEFECALLETMNVDPYLVALWRNSHVSTTVRDMITGISFRTAFQRKSGDASTFFGNTLALMVMVFDIIDPSRIEFAMFAGDDSLVYTSVPRLDIHTDKLAYKYNLECKMLSNFNTNYFCSKFLVPHHGRWFFLPDPLKRAVKLGRRDLRNREHVELYRLSFCDNTKGYRVEELVHKLSDALRERYQVNYDSRAAIMSMGALHTSEKFHALFYSEIGDNLCMDPSIPLTEL